MIRCIEGHVFDPEKHAKCPECGWVPAKSAKKAGHRDSEGSFGRFLGTIFGALTAGVDGLLRTAGIKVQPHVSTGIVYAAMILFCVGAVAYPGSPLWPGNWTQNGDKVVATGEKPTTPERPVPRPEPKAGTLDPTGRPENPPVPEAPKPVKPARVTGPIEVGGANASGFGAIAYSPTARYWGESFGYGNSSAAERRALRECSSAAKGCLLGVSFYRQCGAIAAAGNGVWGSGLGPTPQLAVRDAIMACEGNNGRDCELERVTCTR